MYNAYKISKMYNEILVLIRPPKVVKFYPSLSATVLCDYSTYMYVHVHCYYNHG